MKFKTVCTSSLLAWTLVSGAIAIAQQRNAGGQRNFPQPTPAKEVTVTAIPGVIAAGAQWKLVWQGPDNADGIVGTKEGGLLLRRNNPARSGMLDKNDKFSIYRDTTD
jgi:hypothetical protein